MGINDMVYRTKTYIAGDWTGDSDLIKKLDEWNKNKNLSLSFVNVVILRPLRIPALVDFSLKSALNSGFNLSIKFILE